MRQNAQAESAGEKSAHEKPDIEAVLFRILARNLAVHKRITTEMERPSFAAETEGGRRVMDRLTATEAVIVQAAESLGITPGAKKLSALVEELNLLATMSRK